jgi:hypothetical protein
MAKSMSFLPFVLISCLFPSIIYCVITASNTKLNKENLYKYILFSTPIFVNFFCGYIVLACTSLALAVIFSLAYIFYMNENRKDFITKSTRVFTLCAIPSLVVLFYYAAILIFHSKTNAVPNQLEILAHHLSNTPVDLLKSFSAFLNINTITHEQNLVFGILNILLITCFIVSYKKDILDFSKFEIKLFVVSSFIFLFLFLVCFGDACALSDIFYRIPVLGKTHLYQRWDALIYLFLAIFLSLMLKYVIEYNNENLFKFIALICFLGLLLALLKTTYNYDLGLVSFGGGFIFELLLCGIAFIFLIFKSKKLSIWVFILASFISNANFFYDIYNLKEFTQDKLPSKKIYYNDVEKKVLTDFINRTSADKEMVKLVNLIPNVSSGYFPKNSTWYFSGKLGEKYVSDYYGYELHLSTPKDYLFLNPARIPEGTTNYYNYPNIDYLKNTGADYVIFDDIASPNFHKILLPYIDIKNPANFIKLSNNVTLAKLNFNYKNLIFDNGYIKAFSKDKNLKIDKFESNNSSKTSFNISCEKSAKIVYQFWYSDLLKFYIDGKKVIPFKNNGIAELKLKKGNHRVEIEYKNNLLKIFLFLYCIYILLVLLSLGFLLDKYINAEKA